MRICRAAGLVILVNSWARTVKIKPRPLPKDTEVKNNVIRRRRFSWSSSGFSSTFILRLVLKERDPLQPVSQ
ncbi:hypothetical protein EYF80_052593 [Liparis tanakae]|uniref:Uncharacterized protein n=1 Tax=Liparis tanakae TaxID=230148 RepID=A0A4Z2F8N2_9TELE|nr:hypothetical protein EYF80_052593 [Liparis tanakae]